MQRRIVIGLVGAAIVAGGVIGYSSYYAAWAAGGEHRAFELGDFALEIGVTLPKARLVYVTHGTLNASKSNAVLLPSWYGGDHHGYDFLIGPGKALDPSRHFIIATGQFSNGLSSSPSNAASPFSGSDFPQIRYKASPKNFKHQQKVSYLVATNWSPNSS